MQRSSMFFAALVALPACTVADPQASTTTQADSGYVKYESRRCDVNLCIVHFEPDSDHDGVADADELAAGTDPNDPVRYPEITALAGLASNHALPSFELGNSLLVLVPTRDANGLPLFGGSEMMPARKSSLEAAGIEVPSGMDIARGFTMTRGMASNEMTFHALLNAFGRGEKLTPVRPLADAYSWDSGWGRGNTLSISISNYVITETFDGEMDNGSSISGSSTLGPDGTTLHVKAEDGSFILSQTGTRGADGSESLRTSKTVVRKHVTSLGGVFTYFTNVTIQRETQGKHSVTTTTTQSGKTEPDGKTTESKPHTRVTICDGADCDSFDEVEPEPVEDPYLDSSAGYAYMDPEAAEHSGVVGVYPDAVNRAILARNTTIRVVPNDNDPLSNYEVPPTGIHDVYGPIALFGGDEENFVFDNFGVTPAFVRVPRPEYDPYLDEQQPPLGAPPDQTCLYCFQP